MCRADKEALEHKRAEQAEHCLALKKELEELHQAAKTLEQHKAELQQQLQDSHMLTAELKGELSGMRHINEATKNQAEQQDKALRNLQGTWQETQDARSKLQAQVLSLEQSLSLAETSRLDTQHALTEVRNTPRPERPRMGSHTPTGEGRLASGAAAAARA